MANYKKILMILTFLIIIILRLVNNAMAIELDSKLITEFDYSHIDNDNSPYSYILDSESSVDTTLELSASGIYGLYQYDLRVKGETEEDSVYLDEFLINTMVGDSILEFGKKYWTWGKGFSKYYPTYPLNDEEGYLGSEFSLLTFNSTFKIGGIFDSDYEDLYLAWIRYNSLLKTSDYSLILSYLKDNSDLDPEQRLDSEKKEKGINLGINYSKDFLNGLAVYGEYNKRYWDSLDEKSNLYLFGGEYITKNDKVIVLEYYREKSDYLVWVIGNHGDFFSDWNWQIKDVIDLNDHGDIRTFNLSYSGIENSTYSIEIEHFSGPKSSRIGSRPEDLTINFKVSIDLL